MSFEGRWEQRWHPLRREWVVYSAHRNQRPWSGEGAEPQEAAAAYDPSCYLCPGNARVSGQRNPAYQGVYVFENDHPVVGPEAPQVEPGEGPYRKARAEGLAKVVCYDPRHDVTLNDLSLEGVAAVLKAWQEETRALAQKPGIASALIFENRGKLSGVSNPHPHCQIYATNFIFKHVEQEMQAVAERKSQGEDLFEEILGAESKDGRRIVAQNEGAIAFVPFFARYAYEVWVFPKRRHASLGTLSEGELRDLARVYQELGKRYDLLFKAPFPYVMSLYQAPLKGAHPDYHLHFVFLPPLRLPGLQKFLAGPEIGGGNFMADTLPEEKASELRALNPGDYKPRA